MSSAALPVSSHHSPQEGAITSAYCPGSHSTFQQPKETVATPPPPSPLTRVMHNWGAALWTMGLAAVIPISHGRSPTAHHSCS